MFDKYLKPHLRKTLLKALKWTESSQSKYIIKRRTGKKFWQREIHFPVLIIVAISFLSVFSIMVFEVGLFWNILLGLFAFLVMFTVFLGVFIHNNKPELLQDDEAMMLLGLVILSAVLLMSVFKIRLSPIGTPIAASSILVGLLLSRRLAYFVGVILSLMLGIMNDFNMGYFIVHSFGCITAVASLRSVRNRRDLTRLGIKIIISYIIAVLTLHLFRFWPLSAADNNIVWVILSGSLSMLIVLGVLPYLETFFSRTTNIKLLELADFNQPLLKKLMLEAPGTYHHALIVASLAEQAASAIGANSLLARVGAYYHDIGKLVKPEYFIENQQAMGNPHDPLTPSMSSLVVVSHVKEGVALLEEYKMDKIIIDCIEQHHGTSLIHYFYHRALEKNPESKSENFRYPGPKPRSKETAILMLADSVEAASRTAEDPTPGRFKDMVEKIINNKFTDGQFSECPITLHDLSMISESLVVTLSGIYHARVEYQKTAKPEDRKG